MGKTRVIEVQCYYCTFLQGSTSGHLMFFLNKNVKRKKKIGNMVLSDAVTFRALI